MAHVGKRIKAAREGIDATKLYLLDEAIKLVKSRASAKFDETVEVSMNLGVDPRASTRRRPDGAWRVPAPQRLRPDGSASALLARGPAWPTRPGRPVPTSSMPRTWSSRSRAARSTSIAASPPRHDAAGRPSR